MKTIRKWTITFCKSIRDKDDGEYGTPCTRELTSLIQKYCDANHIKVEDLSIKSPFELSSITITATREKRNSLFSYLKELEQKYILSSINKN